MQLIKLTTNKNTINYETASPVQSNPGPVKFGSTLDVCPNAQCVSGMYIICKTCTMCTLVEYIFIMLMKCNIIKLNITELSIDVVTHYNNYDYNVFNQ